MPLASASGQVQNEKGFSVCESMLENVRKYIANQEEHHKTKSFDDEFEEFLKRAKFEKFSDKEN